MVDRRARRVDGDAARLIYLYKSWPRSSFLLSSYLPQQVQSGDVRGWTWAGAGHGEWLVAESRRRGPGGRKRFSFCVVPLTGSILQPLVRVGRVCAYSAKLLRRAQLHNEAAGVGSIFSANSFWVRVNIESRDVSHVKSMGACLSEGQQAIEPPFDPQRLRKDEQLVAPDSDSKTSGSRLNSSSVLQDSLV